MTDAFVRTETLLGEEAFEKLTKSSVCIFGCGGVGSYVVEALARSGVGKITVVDADVVDVSNINRQLIALNSTVGRPKVDVVKERIEDINPECEVTAKQMFYDKENNFDLNFDYIIDAIDSVPSKLFLIEEANRFGTPIISAMGTGNKLDAGMFEIADISKTAYCPLAKKVRTELKKKGIYHLKVVYSKESPKERFVPPASVSFVPSVAGLLLAGEVIRDLIK